MFQNEQTVFDDTWWANTLEYTKEQPQKQNIDAPSASAYDELRGKTKLALQTIFRLRPAIVSYMSRWQIYLCSQMPFDTVIVFGGVHIVLQWFSKP